MVKKAKTKLVYTRYKALFYKELCLVKKQKCFLRNKTKNKKIAKKKYSKF